ncbi:Metal-dependent hydrolase, endonuclease/exonuclease/phosphatase family [Poseidonocella pacifica]|uniref:Metal-dependent hydrolase, endonuclease/exonuclease/phosphatase family n=1 Tax=Poseidonocella pacifica TaxID=871651 RepID=A0A1I0VHL0_9RHOB|nr:endonuclease/exonuclease/phosphatase family protein [Poseidonocella pacifica]SFA75864.1 Metal-dependent hydrolase, endonuclease/exonuclease/phosphatase family [Poseidonocella pacifica]
MTQPLRIVSYNVQKCVGHDMRRRPDRILDVLEHSRAEIAVLQEVDRRIAPRPSALPFDMLRAAGWRGVQFGGHHLSLGWHGNAILLRGGTTVRRQDRLGLPGLEPRGAVMAELDTRAGPLRIVGVHLGLVRRWRQLQIHEISRHLAELPSMPTVIAGDFNEWRRDTPLMAGTPFRLHTPGRSFPAARPMGPLDRFATCSLLRVSGLGVHTMRPAHIASDHRPVWIEVVAAG